VFLKSFLVVDDDSVLTALYESLIKRRYGDVLVSQAFNGREALDKALALDYSVILSDIDMPVMNGIDFHKSLKKESPCSARRTGFVSSRFGDSYIKEEGLSFLLKPFEQDDFYSLIDSIFESEDRKLNEEMFGCRRSHDRSSVKEKCVLDFQNGLVKGELVDFSKGGFGLQYKGGVLTEGVKTSVSIESLDIKDKQAEMRWAYQLDGDVRTGFKWV